MRFLVPQFIENEPKIIGSLTLKQFIFIGAAGGIGFILYLIIPRYYFILAVIILTPLAIGLAFLKINGRPLPEMIMGFFKFSFTQKLYLWKRKEYLPKFITKKRAPKEKKIKEKILLKISEKSRLKDIKSRIEAGLK